MPKRRKTARKTGRRPGTPKTGGRKKGSLNKVTVVMRGTFAETAQEFSAAALATLVEIMNDKGASASARVRCAEIVLDRGHGRSRS